VTSAPAPPRALVLTGPTACGKSTLALELGTRFPIEIVSMDSAMVYRGMDIGTAKPSLTERRAVPHHLIDIRDPAESYSVGDFCRDALGVIGDVRARSRIPLLVGGTFLYLRSLRRGMASLPPANPAFRDALDQEAARVGWQALHARLARVDPVSGQRIAANDRQRIQRALEVHASTGRPLSSLQQRKPVVPAVDLCVLALFPTNRTELSQRIEQRFDAMVDLGFLEEVDRLYRRGDLGADLPALRAVGYRQLWAHRAGRYDWAEARVRALAATRQLAKRQLTWMRTECPDHHLVAFDAICSEQARAIVQEFIEREA
jgi:tRNA dimethylallyltransferase